MNHQPMQEVHMSLHQAISFYSNAMAINLYVVELQVHTIRDDNPTIDLLIQCNEQTRNLLEQHNFFNNFPQHRLIDEAVVFHDETLKYLRLTLANSLSKGLFLSDTNWHSLLQEHKELCKESNWYLQSLWEEVQNFHIGYDTVFSKSDTLYDRLLRKGKATRILVTALIENYIPYDYVEDEDCFQFRITMLDEDRQIRLLADDEHQYICFQCILNPDRNYPITPAFGEYCMVDEQRIFQYRVLLANLPQGYSWLIDILDAMLENTM